MSEPVPFQVDKLSFLLLCSAMHDSSGVKALVVTRSGRSMRKSLRASYSLAVQSICTRVRLESSLVNRESSSDKRLHFIAHRRCSGAHLRQTRRERTRRSQYDLPVTSVLHLEVDDHCESCVPLRRSSACDRSAIKSKWSRKACAHALRWRCKRRHGARSARAIGTLRRVQPHASWTAPG